MRVNVKLFAVAKQLTGSDCVAVELPEHATVAVLRSELADQHPALRGIAGQLKFAVNADYAADDVILDESQEIACIPPVSGG